MQGGEAQLSHVLCDSRASVVALVYRFDLAKGLWLQWPQWPPSSQSFGQDSHRQMTLSEKKTSSCLFECAQFIDRGAPTNYLVRRRMFLLVVWLEIFQAPMQPVPQIPQALHDDGQLSTMHCIFKCSYLVTKFLARPSSCTSCHIYKSVCVCDIISRFSKVFSAQVPFVVGARTNRHGPTCAFASAWRGGRRLHG